MTSTVTRQRVNTSVQEEITLQQSTTLMKNLMRTAISSIAYLRNLFPEDCFFEKKLTGLSIRSLIPTRPEARLLINWLEKGVFDALDRRYLSDVVFAIYTKAEPENILLECYQFHVDYHEEDAEENCTLQLTHTIRQDSENAPSATATTSSSSSSGTGGEMSTTTTARVYSKEEIRDSTVRLIRTLVTLTQTLKALPSKRFIAIKLQYRDDKTPANYEPCFFRACNEEESELVFHQQPYKVRVGDVQTRYHEITMKMRTIADTYVEPEAVPEQHEISSITHDEADATLHMEPLAEPDDDVRSVQQSLNKSAMTTGGEWILPCNGQSKTNAHARPNADDARMDATAHVDEDDLEERREVEVPNKRLRGQELDKHGILPGKYDHRDCDTDTNYDDNESIRSYEQELEESDYELDHPASPHTRSEARRIHQATPEDSRRALRSARGRGRDATSTYSKTGLSAITPRTKFMTEEFKAQLQLKSAPTSQRKFGRASPRCDYYALPPLGAHVRTNAIALTERTLFNQVAESIVQAGQVPRQQLLAEFSEDGLTPTILRRYIGALEQRGVLEQVAAGRSSRLRVTDLPNALAISHESGDDSTQVSYMDDQYDHAMNDSHRTNPRRLHTQKAGSTRGGNSTWSPLSSSAAAEQRKPVVAGRISDPFDVSALYGSPQRSSPAPIRQSTRAFFQQQDAPKLANDAPISSARLIGHSKTDKASEMSRSRESVYSTKRKGVLSKLTAPAASSNFQSRSVVEEEAAAARTRPSRKRVCVITSESNA